MNDDQNDSYTDMTVPAEKPEPLNPREKKTAKHVDRLDDEVTDVNVGGEGTQRTADYRIDRYGVQIVPRKKSAKSGIKSMHKLTFLDQIEDKIQKAGEETNSKQEGNKSIHYYKKPPNLVTLESDKERQIVNIFYVLSYKKYNAMEVDEEFVNEN